MGKNQRYLEKSEKSVFRYQRNSCKNKKISELHAFAHPRIALKNASELFDLNPLEQDIILKHMWPVTFFSFPKYTESFILTLVDKYCALSEAHEEIYNKFCQKKAFRYAYVFLCLLFIRV